MASKFIARCFLSCLLLSLVVLLVLPVNLTAQERCANGEVILPHTYNTPLPPGSIDGSKNPELIPDVVAYRLFFVAVATSPQPTEAQVRRQRAFLGRIKLPDTDRRLLVSHLAKFRTEYEDFKARENDAADQQRAQGISVDAQASIARRDALVQRHIDELKRKLTPDGMAALNAHIQKEKRNMVIAAAPPMGPM